VNKQKSTAVIAVLLESSGGFREPSGERKDSPAVDGLESLWWKT